MSLNAAPSANRVHISFFGRRNTGKSSLLNAVTGQEMAVVSDVKGTTTDPVPESHGASAHRSCFVYRHAGYG